MIYVIATITLKPGSREAFLEHFHANVPNVLDEQGCQLYQPCVDTPAGLDIQPPDRPDVVTVVEGWDSVEALHAHLKAPHMDVYREKVKDLVEGVDVQVLQPI